MNDIGHGPVFLDTSPFIYFIDRDPNYIEVVDALFEAIAERRLHGITSGITLLETLVIPYRNADLDLASQYESIITNSQNLKFVELDRNILRIAAQIRAEHSIKTPDAVQIAAALSAGAAVFVTNDRALPKLGKIRTVLLSTYA